MKRQKKSSNAGIILAVIWVGVAYFLQGCSSAKINMATPYLDSMHTLSISKYPFEYKEPTIQPYEFVAVKFAGRNPNVTSTLNNYGGADLEVKVTGAGMGFSGQQVGKDGYLDFPLLGKVKASGLTVEELRQELFKKVEPILQDPYVLVSLPKRGVTVIGEVKGASSFVFPKEKTNIFEVLAQAGYSTQFSDLSKVKVYRETEDGQRILGHMNLNDTTFFNSPFFYPLPNDVVYVPASKDRSTQKFTQTVAPLIALGVSVVTLIATLTLRR